MLEEAQDAQVPLLERLKFLAIFSSNLDEFFMVRVGGLQQKVQAGIAYGSGADHMPVKEQLARITQVVRGMTDEAYRCLLDEVLPALEREGIAVRALKDLTEADRRYLVHVCEGRRLAHAGQLHDLRRRRRAAACQDRAESFPSLLGADAAVRPRLRRARGLAKVVLLTH